MTEFMAFRLLIVLVALVAATETIASVTWLPIYFRHGIPLYTRNVVGNLPNTRRDLMDLVACSQTGYSFHRLSLHDIAFREPLVTFTRIPVMHGRLIHDGCSVQVTGLVNWSIVAFGILFFAVGSMFFPHAPIYAILMLAAFVALLAWSHDAQRRRLNDLVVELTAQLKTTA